MLRVQGEEKMKKRYTEEQIALALRQAEGGTAVGEICRKMGGQRGYVLPLEETVSRHGHS